MNLIQYVASYGDLLPPAEPEAKHSSTSQKSKVSSDSCPERSDNKQMALNLGKSGGICSNLVVIESHFLDGLLLCENVGLVHRNVDFM